MTTYKKPKYFSEFRPSQSFCDAKLTSVDKLGTFDLRLTQTKIFEVNEQHYTLPDGEVGLNIIPVVDREADHGSNLYENYPITKNLSGTVEVVGCELLDSIIRQASGLKATTPITAILTYLHFEYGEGNLQDLGNPSLLKTEASQTHSALYCGEGKTRNSPYTYHGKRLKVAGYPAHAYVVKVKDLDQDNFLLNWYIASRLINETNGGVKFPDDYKQDNYHLTNLQQIFEHYRGWVDKEWINKRVNGSKPFNQLLREANVFALYCCEYTTFSLNLALNLPFNKKGFQKVFGSEGAELWEKTRATWRELTGEDIPNVSEFVALWESDGEEKPLLKNNIGQHLAFKPQNTGDLISSFMLMYAPWPYVGVGVGAAVCLGFLPEIQKRTGLGQAQLAPLFYEVIAQMAFYESCSREENHLAVINDISKMIHDEELINFIQAYLTSEHRLEMRSKLVQNGIPTIERVYGQYLEEIESFRKTLDAVVPKNDFDEQLAAELSGQSLEAHVQFYSPPAIFHRIATGAYPSHPRVTVQALGTVMDYSEVVHVGTIESSQTKSVNEERGTK